MHPNPLPWYLLISAVLFSSLLSVVYFLQQVRDLEMARVDFQQSFQGIDAANSSTSSAWDRGESKGEDLTSNGGSSTGEGNHLNGASLYNAPAAAVVAALQREAQDEQWWGGTASVTAAGLKAHAEQDDANTTTTAASAAAAKATLPAEGDTVRQRSYCCFWMLTC